MRRTSAIQGALTIMYGCNNFCTYCVVPYVRGRERSRSVADVVREAESMAASGIQEILLLGQNVNSYAGGATFPELLRALDGVVPRIRFMTSHPKDLSDALIEEMARSRSVCPQFHLPVQSGNDKVLREMNRVYTRAHYLERVRALRQAIPEVGLTTDVIAGFPGETEAEFADTLSLVEEVQYDSAFTFIYSPRRGTRAAARPDQIPEAVQHERLDRLIRVQERATASRLAPAGGLRAGGPRRGGVAPAGGIPRRAHGPRHDGELPGETPPSLAGSSRCASSARAPTPCAGSAPKQKNNSKQGFEVDFR